MPNKLRIKYVRSVIGRSTRQKRTIEALGLHRLGQVVEHEDAPAIRGMVDKVSHLVEVEEVSS